MKTRLMILWVITGLAACLKTGDRNPILPGNWQATEWIRYEVEAPYLPATMEMDASKVRFEFTENDLFIAHWGDKNEQGKWRTEKDQLFLKGDGKKETMLKIIRIDSISLELDMNPGGTKEIMKLARMKS